PPGAAAVVPWHARPPGRAGLRCDDHRCDNLHGGQRGGHRADRGAGRGPGGAPRHRGHPARADQERRTDAAGRDGGPDGRRGLPHRGAKGADSVTDARVTLPLPAAVDTRRPVRRALISVYDKTGLAELGAGLAAAGVQIVSTGSTAGALRAAGVTVTEVEEL